MSRLFLPSMLAVTAVLALAGCQDDDGSAPEQSASALSGELFTQTAHSGRPAAV